MPKKQAIRVPIHVLFIVRSLYLIEGIGTTGNSLKQKVRRQRPNRIYAMRFKRGESALDGVGSSAATAA